MLISFIDKQEQKHPPDDERHKTISGPPLLHQCKKKRNGLYSRQGDQPAIDHAGNFFMPFIPDQGVEYMAAVELSDRREIQCGEEKPKPACKQKRVVIHFVHGGYIIEKASKELVKDRIDKHDSTIIALCDRGCFGIRKSLCNMFGNHFMPCEVFNIGGLREGKEADEQDSEGYYNTVDRLCNPDIKKLFGSADLLFNANDGTKGPDSKRYRNEVGEGNLHVVTNRCKVVPELMYSQKCEQQGCEKSSFPPHP